MGIDWNHTSMVLNQGWSLIDFDDTKTLLIRLLIKLLSISEVYLEPKTKASFKGLRKPIQWKDLNPLVKDLNLYEQNAIKK